MKKNWICLLVLIIQIILINCLLVDFVNAEVRLNEIIAHTGTSYGFEIVEIYSDEIVNLTNWTIGDLVSNDTINLNITNNYALIIDAEQENCSLFDLPNESCIALSSIGSGLNDGAETVFLYDNEGNLVDFFNWSTDIKSSGKSWSFNGILFQECTPTPGQANNCSVLNND